MPGESLDLLTAYVTLSSRGKLAEELARAEAQARQVADTLSKGMDAATARAVGSLMRLRQQNVLAMRGGDAAAETRHLDSPGGRALAWKEQEVALTERTVALQRDLLAQQAQAGGLGTETGRQEMEKQLALLRQMADVTPALAAAAAPRQAQEALNRRSAEAAGRAARVDAAAALVNDPHAGAARANEVGADFRGRTSGLQDELAKLRERERLLASPEGAAELERQLELRRQLAAAAERGGTRDHSDAMEAELAGLRERNRLLGTPEGSKELERQLQLERQIAAEREKANRAVNARRPVLNAQPAEPAATPRGEKRDTSAAARERQEWAALVAQYGVAGAHVFKIREGFGGATAAINQMAGAMQKFAAAASLGGLVTAAGIERAVSVGAPAIYHKFELATRDLTGVVGQVLAPALEKVTVVVRGLANFLASLTPHTKQFFAAVAVGSVVAVAAVGAITVALGLATLAASALAAAMNLGLGGIPAAVGVIVTAFGAMAGAIAAGFAGAGAGFLMTRGSLDTLAKIGGVLRDVFGPWLAAIGAEWQVAGALIGKVVDVVVAGMGKLAPVLEQWKQGFASVIGFIQVAGSHLVDFVGRALQFAGTVLGDVVPALAQWAGQVNVVITAMEALYFTLEGIAVALSKIDLSKMKHNFLDPRGVFEFGAAVRKAFKEFDLDGYVGKNMAAVERAAAKARKGFDFKEDSQGHGGNQATIGDVGQAIHSFYVKALQSTTMTRTLEQEEMMRQTELQRKIVEGIKGLNDTIAGALGYQPTPVGMGG